ncbi:hypothetical protein EXQ31_13275 [Clostridium botulinum]|uniref:hypothetical protein n=1 Tax=Clostridium botulinum TaxID=1491 RepID=UPI001A935920|nr:hypothetical protein [Clostridium botulinum]MBO0525024.1 hypothetical protein [Clostridium botulinum]MBO0532439.1 hypothetical protein [Clostridium botulinum]MBO0546499.1 hypothetical protein [Clostridium botulinum]MBO0550251.1 hypothetical protein [Clostridium botulinum]MBO0553463.1 hypothetical protein [Clostridium botulinum]
MMNKFINKFNNLKITISTFITILLTNILCNPVLAAPSKSVVTNSDAEAVGTRIVDAIQQISFPVGSALIFLCIVLSAVRIISTHYNPNARSEALRSILWIAIGALILGSALIIAGVFTKVAAM